MIELIECTLHCLPLARAVEKTRLVDAKCDMLRGLIRKLDHGGEAEIDCPVCGHCFDAHTVDCPVGQVVDG